MVLKGPEVRKWITNCAHPPQPVPSTRLTSNVPYRFSRKRGVGKYTFLVRFNSYQKRAFDDPAARGLLGF